MSGLPVIRPGQSACLIKATLCRLLCYSLRGSAPGILTEIMSGLRVCAGGTQRISGRGVGPLPMYNNNKMIRSHQTGRVG